MRPRTALLATLSLFAGARAQDARDALVVRVDPRVELLSIVFRLAGNPEYGRGKVDRYTDAVEAWFGKHREHEVVRLARSLRAERGVSFDAVAGLAVHLEGTGDLDLVVPWQPRPNSLDERWTVRDLRRFLRALRRFADKARFDEFVAAHEELYATAAERMRARLTESAELGWFDAFFGARPSARFEVALALLNGGANYGPHVTFPDGREDLHCVLGVWATDDDGLPSFPEDVVPTVVHEFCHSYCNRLVDAHWAELEAAAHALWPHVESEMRSQAYGNPRTMMRESLVRACVIRYQAAQSGPRARQLEIAAQHRNGFLWAGELSDLLVEYEGRRDEFAQLDAFMPTVVEWFGDYAADFAAELAKFPRVVSITPENGARDVDPRVGAIVVTFDRRMADGSWSFVGGGPKYPKTTGRPAYDAACQVLTLPVQLEPDHEYEFWLNRGTYDSFRSAEGVPLRSVHVTFRTRAK